MADTRTEPNLARTHGVWPSCPVCVCVCVCVAEGGLHLNIYQEQWLPKGECCAVFTGWLLANE